MEGAGIFTLAVLLLASPFLIWADREEKFRRLDPIEQNLRRASQGIALPVVIVAAAVLFFGPSARQDFVAAFIADPASWPRAVFLAALLACCLVRAGVGMQRSAGTRDALLAARALVKFALGAAGVFYLWPGNADLSRLADVPPWVWRALVLLALWCAVIGAVRSLLLMIGGSTALRRVHKHIQQTQIVMRPACRRSWWKFW
jgi:hypothetical protein